MIKDDYIIKMIQEIGKMLAQLLFNKESVEEITTEVDQNEEMSAMQKVLLQMIVENKGLNEIRNVLAKDGQLSELEKTKVILSAYSNLETTDQMDVDGIYSIFCDLIADLGYQNIIDLFER